MGIVVAFVFVNKSHEYLLCQVNFLFVVIATTFGTAWYMKREGQQGRQETKGTEMKDDLQTVAHWRTVINQNRNYFGGWTIILGLLWNRQFFLLDCLVFSKVILVNRRIAWILMNKTRRKGINGARKRKRKRKERKSNRVKYIESLIIFHLLHENNGFVFRFVQAQLERRCWMDSTWRKKGKEWKVFSGFKNFLLLLILIFWPSFGFEVSNWLNLVRASWSTERK